MASMAKIARTMAFVGARVAITAAPAAPEALVRQAQLEIRDLDSRSINPFVHAAAALPNASLGTKRNALAKINSMADHVGRRRPRFAEAVPTTVMGHPNFGAS